MIVAAAQQHEVSVATQDERIQKSGLVAIIW